MSSNRQQNKLSQQIDNFKNFASIVDTLCKRYNKYSIKPFLEGAQVYRENFRSATEFLNLLRLHRAFLLGSIDICNRLFDNYDVAKQNLIYTWSRHFFNLVNSSKKVIDAAYNLAYTVGRDDVVTNNLVAKEKNPLVEIQRRVILEEGEYDSYKKTMFDWKCNMQSVYVEERYMNSIVELCNSRHSKPHPEEVKISTCARRRAQRIIIPDNDYESTPPLCVLNAELLLNKGKIDLHEKNKQLTVEDIDNYVTIYNSYQRELISFVFTNFLQLYNETCVQCIKIFLEQQHSVVFNLLQVRKTLESRLVERNTAENLIQNISWTDINKTTTNTCGNGGSKDSCINSVKVVGSLT